MALLVFSADITRMQQHVYKLLFYTSSPWFIAVSTGPLLTGEIKSLQ